MMRHPPQKRFTSSTGSSLPAVMGSVTPPRDPDEDDEDEEDDDEEDEDADEPPVVREPDED